MADAVPGAAVVVEDVGVAEGVVDNKHTRKPQDALRASDYFILQWHITDQCNLRCQHCYQDKYENAGLPLDALEKVFHQIIALSVFFREEEQKKSLKFHITVTGGEPFIREDLFGLLEIITTARPPFSFSILTNGTLLTPSIVKKLKEFSPQYIQISLDGGKSTHDSLRGRGNFEASVSAIKELIKNRIPVSVSFTANRKNAHEFNQVAKICKKLHVDRLWSDRFVPIGNGSIDDTLVMGPLDAQAFIQSMFALKRKESRFFFKKPMISMHRSLQFLIGGGRPYECTAGGRLITIMPNGNVTPCRRMPIIVGNVFDTPLTEIYTTNPLLQKLRDSSTIPRDCENCFYKMQCRGGARCQSYAHFKTPFKKDPDCFCHLFS